MRERPPTMRDVAAAAGVHVSTVSRALRADPAIPEATARRVRAAAQRLGFRPDPRLSAFAISRWSQGRSAQTPLAIVRGRLGPPAARAPAPGIAEAAAARAVELGYMPIVANQTEADGSLRKLLQSLRARGCDNIVLNHWDVPPDTAPEDTERLNIVCLQQGRARLPHHLVDQDMAASTALCLEACAARGYARPGAVLFVHEPGHLPDAVRGGVIRHFHAHGNPAGTAILEIPASASQAERVAAIARWFHKTRPDAVIGFNTAVYHYLVEAGVSVPGGTGFCAIFDARPGDPAAGCFVSQEALAGAAVDLVNVLYRTHRAGPVRTPAAYLVPPVWHEGTSLPRRETRARAEARAQRKV